MRDAGWRHGDGTLSPAGEERSGIFERHRTRAALGPSFSAPAGYAASLSHQRVQRVEQRFDFSFVGRAWTWRKRVGDRVVCASTRRFSSLSDCIADARRAGFQNAGGAAALEGSPRRAGSAHDAPGE
jgi:hypothetical protein